MNHETQIALIERVHAHIAARTTDTGPGGRVDPRSYTDPERYEREREVLFRDTPLIVCHTSELATPGDFVTRDVAGQPLLLSRDAGGTLHGFLNVCRHRGTRVVDDASGSGCKHFTCPYHGWSYGADGALRGVPHGSGFPDLDRSRRGLARVPVAEQGGFVWALPRRSDQPLYVPDALARLTADLDSWGLPDHVVYRRRTIHHAVNWKLAFDVFLEAYHLRTTHTESIYPMFFDNLGLVDRFDPHLRNIFPKRSIAELVGTDPASWSLREHANILYVLLPNTLVLVQPDHAGVLHASPEGPDRTRMDCYLLVPETPTTDRARRYWDANDEILHRAIEEDFTMGESIQRGLASGANESLVLGRFEHALGYFHEFVADAIRR
jgi:phenylpropionate dioxygenase-like ring-hydroxylating dioxygenase large terminal subunit